MAINWSHLPPEVIEKICMCIGRDRQDGYSLDRVTGYWVHAGKKGCWKPSVATSVVECEECEKPFVPNNYRQVQLSFLGAVCQKCEEND